ncbi:MAG: RNA methyltransferase [Acidobacteria bacterium]|nr:RNA methyltransferase [Acidobacteriota bacterium]
MAETVLETISDTVNSQGLIVIAKRPVFSLEDLSANNPGEPLIVCLDKVQDPGNFGTIVRTAEAAGASGVIALKGCVDAWAPKTLRSSMGSAFRLPMATEISDEEFIRYADNGSFRIVATFADGETLYTDFDWRDPVIVVFGNEAHGISRKLMERCDAGLRIPIREPVESLNVSAAAAAILFEAVRQRT